MAAIAAAVVFTTFAVASSVSAGDAGQPTASTAEAPAPNTIHGFLLDQGVFTTIDAPGAASFTIAAGINTSG
jgi:hypothetical protein